MTAEITVKDFLQGDNIDEKDYLTDMTSYHDFYQAIKTNDALNDAPKGLIPLMDFFDEENQGDFEGEMESVVNNLDDFIEEYGNWTTDPDEAVYDNTYNYMGQIASPIDFAIIHMVNPNSRAYEAKDLLLMKVCLNSDVRGGYTEYVGALFDSDIDNGDHYQALSFLSRRFNVFNCDMKINGVKYIVSVDATAMQDTQDISIISDDNEEDYEDDSYAEEEYEDDSYAIDLDDKDDIAHAISEIMDIDPNEIKLNNLDYTIYY